MGNCASCSKESHSEASPDTRDEVDSEMTIEKKLDEPPTFEQLCNRQAELMASNLSLQKAVATNTRKSFKSELSDIVSKHTQRLPVDEAPRTEDPISYRVISTNRAATTPDLKQVVDRYFDTLEELKRFVVGPDIQLDPRIYEKSSEHLGQSEDLTLATTTAAATCPSREAAATSSAAVAIAAAATAAAAVSSSSSSSSSGSISNGSCSNDCSSELQEEERTMESISPLESNQAAVEESKELEDEIQEEQPTLSAQDKKRKRKEEKKKIKQELLERKLRQKQEKLEKKMKEKQEKKEKKVKSMVSA